MTPEQGGERAVARHYAHVGLEAAINAALAAAGKDPARLVPADLAPVDEFHIGGRKATAEFAARLGLAPGMHVLDIGSGLGGTSRYLAEAHGCTVTGIDLTDDYVRVAASLARQVGLDGRVAYRQGSALALPFAPASFDAATMLHVGMNIADKAALCAGVRRVLVPGGIFAIYDVMRREDGELAFPVPWAARAETSFLASPAAYRAALEQAGFAIIHERDRWQFAIDFFRELRARAAQTGLPPLGTHILMGESAPQKVANLLANLERRLVAPVEIVGRAR